MREERGSSDQPTILVVEDETLVRMMIVRHLRDQGFSVIEAADGDVALDLMSSSIVDLVFADVVMPRMSGVTLARRVQENYPGIPILLTSGFTNDNRVPVSIPYVQKPYEPEEVEAIIRELLSFGSP